MTCENIREKLFSADGLNESVPVEIAEHTAGCPECRALLCELCAMEKALHGAALPAQKDGVPLHEHIAARIAAGDIAPAYKRRRFPIATFVAAAAVLAIAIVGGPLRGFMDKADNFAADEALPLEMISEPAEKATGSIENGAAEDSGLNNKQAPMLYSAESDSYSIAVEEAEFEKSDETADTNAPVSEEPKIKKTEMLLPKTENAVGGVSNSITMNAVLDESEEEIIEEEAAEEEAVPEEAVTNSSEAHRYTTMASPLGDVVFKTADEVFEAAKEALAKLGCSHTDGRHDITEAMAQSIGEETFVEWYLELDDLEEEYTVENFRHCFEESLGQNG